jgi:hypothetical protein
MDWHILKDPVRQREVKEITNFAEHDLKAKQMRYRYQKVEEGRKKCPEIGERVRYTVDEEGDGAERDDFARRNYELESKYRVYF